jgi:hypothetical protein
VHFPFSLLRSSFVESGLLSRLWRAHVSPPTVLSFVCNPYRLLALPPFGINLDAFDVCASEWWRTGVFFFVAITTAFGTPSLSNLHYDFTSGVLMCLTPTLWHRRWSWILGHFGHSQETREEYTRISGNAQHFGVYSPGRDDKLRARVCLSLVAPAVLGFCPGR